MLESGIVRNVDVAGRIVIPKEVRHVAIWKVLPKQLNLFKN